MNKGFRFLSLCIFTIFIMRMAYATNWRITKLSFQGWTEDSSKCVFINEVEDDASGLLVPELITVTVSSSSVQIEKYPFGDDEAGKEKMLTDLKLKKELGAGLAVWDGKGPVKSDDPFTLNPSWVEMKSYIDQDTYQGAEAMHFASDTVVEDFIKGEQPGDTLTQWALHTRMWIGPIMLLKEDRKMKGRWELRQVLREAYVSPDMKKVILSIENRQYNCWPSICLVDISDPKNIRIIGKKFYDIN